MTKKFCISTNGLSKDQKHEFATELNEFVQKKKKQFMGVDCRDGGRLWIDSQIANGRAQWRRAALRACKSQEAASVARHC